MEGSAMSIRWFIALVTVAALLLAAPALGAEFKGTVNKVLLEDDKVVVVNAEGEERTFHFDDTTIVRINDREAKAKDLKAGDEVIIVHEEEDDLNFAKEMRGTRP
jgi:hypothetical protein